MKHAFSNFIRIAISKLLAYLVSTFCRSCIAKYSHVRTCDAISKNLSLIAQLSHVASEQLRVAMTNPDYDCQGGKENDR